MSAQDQEIRDPSPKENPYLGTPLERDWLNLRTMIRGIYDMQGLRIMMGNRIAANFKSKLGITPGKKEESDKEAMKIILDIKKSYKRLTDGIVKDPTEKNFKGDDLISTYTDFVLVHNYIELLSREEDQFKRLEKVVRLFPIYTHFLKGVRGCGPAMSSVLISEINIKKSKYASSVWAYCGLDVALDNRGRGRYKEHLIDCTYIDKDGNEAVRKSITFNPRLKTKLMGVLAPSFIKTDVRSIKVGPELIYSTVNGKKKILIYSREVFDEEYRGFVVVDTQEEIVKHKNEKIAVKKYKVVRRGSYAAIYYNYINRLNNMAAHKDKSKGHKNRMALRKMIKIFLIDLYTNWRTLEGLPCHDPYHEGKLGHKHSA